MKMVFGLAIAIRFISLGVISDFKLKVSFNLGVIELRFEASMFGPVGVSKEQDIAQRSTDIYIISR